LVLTQTVVKLVVFVILVAIIGAW